MFTVTLAQAQADLAGLIRQLAANEEVIIVENDRPVARLLSVPAAAPKAERQCGTLRGTVLWMSPDFDEPLEDFREYME